MKRRFTLVIACLFLVIAVFNSCKKDNNIDTTKTTSENSVLAYIKSLGFKDSDIREAGDKYIVDGDIVFYKNRIYKLAEKPSAEGKKTSQYGTGSYVNKTHIIIRVDASMNGYINEINDAINIWNNAGGVLRFSIYNGSGPYDITIYSVNSSGDYCGRGDFPANGNPGYFINIDLGFIQYAVMQSSGNFNTELRSTISHEIGHNIGMMHTNQVGNQHIPGTPTAGNDAASIMNGGVCGHTPTVLSANDIHAYKYLYPVPYSISGPIAFCNTASYSVTNLPSGATVTWTTSGEMSIVGSNTASTVTVAKNSDAYAYLSATITTAMGGTYVLPPAGIIVGAPSYIPHEYYAVMGEANAVANTYPLYTYSMPAFPGAISYSWDVSGGVVPATLYNNNTSNPHVDVKFNGPGYHSIFVTVTTECGQVSLDGQQLEVNVTSGY